MVLLALVMVLQGCTGGAEAVLEEEMTETAGMEAASYAALEETKETETSAQWIFGEPASLYRAVEDGNYLNVSEINDENAKEEEGFVFLDAAKFSFLEIGGIEQPSENENRYYRLSVRDREKYSVLNEAFAECTAGVTLRFRTDADEIRVCIIMSDAQTHFYHIPGRGAYGIDIYTGTGTERIYRQRAAPRASVVAQPSLSLVTFLLCGEHRPYLGRDRPALHRGPERDCKQKSKQQTGGVAFIPQLKQWVFPLQYHNFKYNF